MLNFATAYPQQVERFEAESQQQIVAVFSASIEPMEMVRVHIIKEINRIRSAREELHVLYPELLGRMQDAT